MEIENFPRFLKDLNSTEYNKFSLVALVASLQLIQSTNVSSEFIEVYIGLTIAGRLY